MSEKNQAFEEFRVSVDCENEIVTARNAEDAANKVIRAAQDWDWNWDESDLPNGWSSFRVSVVVVKKGDETGEALYKTRATINPPEPGCYESEHAFDGGDEGVCKHCRLKKTTGETQGGESGLWEFVEYERP